MATAAAAMLLAGCVPVKTTEVNQPASSPSSSAAPAPVAHVGAALNLTGNSGEALSATLTQLINPATGELGPPTDASGNANGNSYVATMLAITNTGSSAMTSDADNDATLIGSDGQTYTAQFQGLTECTNFDHGVYKLGAGESTNGCVAFSLPAGVTPAKFKYSPSSGFASDFGEWLIP